MSPGALVLVADRTRARLFSWAGPGGELLELDDLVNPAVRLPARALVTDRQGRSLNRQRGSRTALGTTTWQRDSMLRFAREIGARLGAELRARHAARLWVFAETEFLGALRAALQTRRIAVPVQMLAKNLTRADTRRIRGYLPGDLPYRV